MSSTYTLIGQTPVPEPDTLTWAAWFEEASRNNARRVALTRLPWCYVSTVFLGIDHSHRRLLGDMDDPPLLFESMAFWEFGGGDEQTRCATWTEAEAMHAVMVAAVSRPGPVFAALWSAACDTIDAARADWRKLWRELK